MPSPIKAPPEVEMPDWVSRIKEMLYYDHEEINLVFLARETGIHPVYLSRAFPKYFKSHFGEYFRKIKLERTVSHLREKNVSLTSIAYECGFSDQSHFIRSFKAAYGITPGEYRRRMLGTGK